MPGGLRSSGSFTGSLGIPACPGGCPPGEAVPAVWGGGAGRVWRGTQPGGHTKEGSEEPEGLGVRSAARQGAQQVRGAVGEVPGAPPRAPRRPSRRTMSLSHGQTRSVGSAGSSVLTKGLGARRCQVPTQPA